MPWTKKFTVDLLGLHQHIITHSIRAIALDETDDIVVLVDTANNVAINLHQVVDVIRPRQSTLRQARVMGFRIPKKPQRNSKLIRVKYVDSNKVSHVAFRNLKLAVIPHLKGRQCLLPRRKPGHS